MKLVSYRTNQYKEVGGMDQCELCQLEGLGDCDTCYLADPCYGCEHTGDCHGECGMGGE